MSTQSPKAAVPPLPTSFGGNDLKASGFEGWLTWNQLRQVGFAPVPSGPAVYVVAVTDTAQRSFSDQSAGGWFKGKNPTVSLTTLEANWVPDAHVIYIGKADGADRRLKQFAQFGVGEPVGHWGGRLNWQLGYPQSSLVAWHRITGNEPPATTRSARSRISNSFTAARFHSRTLRIDNRPASKSVMPLGAADGPRTLRSFLVGRAGKSTT